MILSKALKKLIVVILIVLTLNNFIFSNLAFAEDGDENVIVTFVETSLKTVVGLFTLPIRILTIAIARAMIKLTAAIAYCESPDADDSDGNLATISPYDILFNKVKIVDINFFDIDGEDSIVMTIRRGVAAWYYAMRIIAAIILLAVLVYVGIRMALSTIASDRALYQKMLVDWAVSVALIFLLSYIIVFVININSILVNTIGEAISSGSGDTNSINVAIEKIGIAATKLDINSIAATIVYVLLAWQTLALLIAYFSRMLKLAFLLIISPLITLTYAIDKIGDGKAQALNAWLKEFTYTILIQPFHCIIYAVLVNTALTLLVTTGDEATNKVAAGLIAILCIKFIREAEEIVRKIFNFADNNNNTSLAAGAAAAMVGMKYAAGAGKTAGMFAGKSVNFAVNAARNMPQTLANIGANAYALRTMIGNNGKTFEERKDDYYEKHDNEKADREEEKLKNYERAELSKASTEEEKQNIRQKYTTMKNDMDKAVSARAVALRNNNPRLTASRAKALARKEMAEQYRKNERDRKPSVIRGVKTGGKEIYNLARNSKVLKSMGDIARFNVSAAVGTVMGSGAYSNNSDLFTSIGAGIASYSATNASIETFFKQTGGELANTTKNNFVALGAVDETKMMEIANRVLANSADYDDDDKLKSLLDDIKNELKKAGANEKQASQIHNYLRKGATSGEPYIPDDILKNIVGSDKATEGLLKATRKLSNYENERSIYQAIQSSEDLGKSSVSYVADVRSHTTASDYKRAQAFDFDVGSDIAQEAREGEIDTEVLDVNEKRRIEKDIDRALETARENYDRQRGYDVASQALEKEIENLERNKLKIQIELKREYERNASDLSKQLQEIKKEISKEEARAKAQNVLDKESFLREIEREASRREKEIEDLKRSAETIAIPGIKQKIAVKETELERFKNNSTAVANEVEED